MQAHRDLCEECLRSAFLLGRETDFVVTLLWAIGPKNEAKIRSGQYRDKPRKKPKKTGDPVYDEYMELNFP